MFRTLFLVLVLLTSATFAQTDDNNAPKDVRPEAVKLFEVKSATNGYVKMLFSQFLTNLNADPTAQGYIINYGSDIQIARRERQIGNAVSILKIDRTRITMVR